MNEQRVFRPGDKCGKYDILHFAAAGGNGEVYKAIERSTERLVAVKVLRLTHAHDEVTTTRLKREARLLCNLLHPNIVIVFETQIEGEGNFWIAMEWLDGMTLRELQWHVRRFSVADALYYLIEITKALSFAHENGIVHRDLKHENVFVTKRDDVKLMDFGTAKFHNFGYKSTDPGRVPGTPFYMAPEQIKGQVVDGRADIYAIGLIGYELMAGHHVFMTPGQEDMPTTNEIIAWHLSRHPSVLREEASWVPEDVSDLIDRAIAKDPRHRPTAEEFRKQATAIRERLLVSGKDGEALVAEEEERSRSFRQKVFLTAARDVPVPSSRGATHAGSDMPLSDATVRMAVPEGSLTTGRALPYGSTRQITVVGEQFPLPTAPTPILSENSRFVSGDSLTASLKDGIEEPVSEPEQVPSRLRKRTVRWALGAAVLTGVLGVVASLRTRAEPASGALPPRSEPASTVGAEGERPSAQGLAPSDLQAVAAVEAPIAGGDGGARQELAARALPAHSPPVPPSPAARQSDLAANSAAPSVPDLASAHPVSGSLSQVRAVPSPAHKSDAPPVARGVLLDPFALDPFGNEKSAPSAQHAVPVSPKRPKKSQDLWEPDWSAPLPASPSTARPTKAP